MHRVGSLVMAKHTAHNSHILFDPDKGRLFLVRAANRGYAPSKLSLGRMDGGDPTELEGVAREMMEDNVSGYTF